MSDYFQSSFGPLPKRSAASRWSEVREGDVIETNDGRHLVMNVSFGEDGHVIWETVLDWDPTEEDGA